VTNTRYKFVIIYGHRTVYHPTFDLNEPLCWREGTAKLDSVTPGYDDPTWIKPKVVREGEAIALGRSLCGNCARVLGPSRNGE
jgi:hypothetical protein